MTFPLNNRKTRVLIKLSKHTARAHRDSTAMSKNYSKSTSTAPSPPLFYKISDSGGTEKIVLTN
jgi:hypothetical protein